MAAPLGWIYGNSLTVRHLSVLIKIWRVRRCTTPWQSLTHSSILGKIMERFLSIP
ncbi:MAG: hypothetical protein M0003_12935 [Acidithiobacillus sp.]|nr:hypothetical protein [Acidithiobacillus sp.]